ncbi:type II secretion system protein [Patescibacteria group bacterium]
MNKKGFTLIELLIVIALLGILALALLAAIDPFEQLKKGRDTGTRNGVEELYNASLRYYAIRGEFPWEGTTLNATQALEMTDFIQSIVEAGEIKEEFLMDPDRLERLWVTSTHADILDNMDDLAVCFSPESRAFRIDQNTIYDPDGQRNTTDCPTTDYETHTCFWCIR